MNNTPTLSPAQDKALLNPIWDKNKIRNTPIFVNCTNCVYSDSCLRDENCSFLQVPLNASDDSIEIESIRKLSHPSPGRRMKAGLDNRRAAPDDKTPTYQYHRRIINECLADIRAGHIGYLYTQQCLHDLFCFEPTANVIKQDGVYYISLTKGDINGTDTTNAN